MVVYVLETLNTDETFPYASCIKGHSKFSGNENRDVTQGEYEKSRKSCIAFRGTDSVNDLLDYVLQFKGKAKKVNDKTVKYSFYLLAHKGSRFDSYVVLNKLPQWITVVGLIKNGLGIVSLKIFNGYLDQNKKIPQYVHFRCGL